MKTLIKTVIALFMALALSNGALHAENEPKNLNLNLSYNKYSDGGLVLIANATSRINGKFEKQLGIPVSFYAVSESGMELLATVKTNFSGTAVLALPNNFRPYKDPEGLFTFQAEVEGNKFFNEAETEISLKEAAIEISFSEEESVRTVTAFVFETDASGEKTPLADVELTCNVHRLYLPLTLGIEPTDEEGLVSFVFPDDLPGGMEGDVSITMAIMDNDEYGNVEAEKTINWGIPLSDSKLHPERALSSMFAPFWMVITLIVLLTGTYSHFILIIYKLVQIKKNQ